VEAPSSAIAQLGQLDDTGRRRFGRITLWLTLAVVGTLTLGLTAAAVRLRVGVPTNPSTQLAELARRATRPGLFATFQAATTLLLLAAASSSFQAGPGLLKALARHPTGDRTGHPTGHRIGILLGRLGRTNDHHTPYWGVVVFGAIACAVTAAAGGRDQRLVLFYAVSVFLSFLVGLLAMAWFSWRERTRGLLLVNLVGALVVAFTLAVNLARGAPIASLAAALLLAAGLYAGWVRAGRPSGIQHAAAQAEAEDRAADPSSLTSPT
jgi:Amino acid permease